jgi:hypothetical protein
MALVKGYENQSIKEHLLALGLGRLLPYPCHFGITFIPLKAFQIFEPDAADVTSMVCHSGQE